MPIFASMTEIKTLAVLPFANLSGDASYDYLCDGVTEEITNALSKISTLKVTSRTSAFFFKGKNESIEDMAKKLNAGTLLQGSIRVSERIMRLSTQLIQAENDFQFWSETWDRPFGDILKLQDEISALVAEKIREQTGHFDITEGQFASESHHVDAYTECLKADYYRNKWNPEDVKTAILLYRNALSMDNKLVAARGGIADCYSFLGTVGFIPYEEAWKTCHDFTEKAFVLDKNNAAVYYQLSNRAFFIACDYKKSVQDMRQAIALNPNYSDAHQFLSFLYTISNDFSSAQKHLDLAYSINPLSDELRFFRAFYKYMRGDFAEAMQLLDQCLASNPYNIPAHSVKSFCLLNLGRFQEALHYMEKLPDHTLGINDKIGTIGLSYAFLGESEQVEEHVERLKKEANGANKRTAESYIFMLFAVTRSVDETLDYLQQKMAEKSSVILLRLADPLLKKVHQDPRYLKMRAEIFNLDEKVMPPKGKRILLDKEKMSDYTAQLLKLIDEEQPYLDAKLSLRSLAEKLDLHPNHLSWLLNESMGKNFNEFINHYRVNHFIKMLKDSSNSHVTFLGLAYDSGFNSKSVFNNYFKKETGLSPREYQKQNNT